MPFKIVQTLERGKLKLVIVPSFWEDKGKLWWPPKKILDKVIKDEQSKPHKEWKLMKCALKRNYIPTYQDADTELSVMELNSDTDMQENDTAVVQPRESVLQTENRDEINFEVLANNLTLDQDNSIMPTNEDVLQIYSAEPLINCDQILANQKILSEKMDAMLQIQGIVIENQKKLTQKLAALSVQVEEMSQLLANQRDQLSQPTNVVLLKDANPIDNESFSFKSIENESELEALEKMLEDKARKLKLRKQLSFICSASEGNGITCAYKLIDIIFNRNFLCLCSWSGGSRAEKSKIALENYKNVLNLFFLLVHTWDPQYTIQKNDLFFKTVTKNAKQRVAMKNLRMSTKRCRKDKDETVKRQKTMNKNNTIAENIQGNVFISEQADENQSSDEENEGLC